jgi:hypothetical protein
MPELGVDLFVVYEKLKVSIGGVDVELPALAPKPRGVSIRMHLASVAGEG